MTTCFEHEKLDVYQDAIRFASRVDALLKGVDSGTAVLVRIVPTLVGLVRSTSPHRVHEGPAECTMRQAGAGGGDYD
ncbi:MAG: hypothetical protein FJ221_03915 [Lentisphaerae bacterium]|nr:hypothetical protein [Lentisphaerota bacterium]